VEELANAAFHCARPVVVMKQVTWLVVTEVWSESLASGWSQSAFATLVCYVPSLIFLPVGCHRSV